MSRKTVKWEELYADWKQSGMTPWAYAKTTRSAAFTSDGTPVGLNYLYNLCRRRNLAHREQSSVSVRVHKPDLSVVNQALKTQSKPSATARTVTLHVAGGSRIEFVCNSPERFALDALALSLGGAR